MAKKRESTFLSMMLTLFLVALVASGTLGMVYELTKDPIAKAKADKQQAAIKAVLPEFDELGEPFRLPVAGNDSIECFPAKKGGQLVGYAVKTYSDDGFTERIWLMAGFTTEGIIHNTAVLAHKETPGLGTKMTEAPFKPQFEQLDPSKTKLCVSKDCKENQGKIDAITAATISSRAFCDALDRAYQCLKAGGRLK